MRDIVKLTLSTIAVISVSACGQTDRGNSTSDRESSTNVQNAIALADNPVAGGMDWPRFRGPQANGISLEKDINKNWGSKAPRKLWQVSLSDKGFAGPSCANGLVYIIDHSGSQDIIRALRLSDGNEAWNFPYDDTESANYGYARSTPTVDGDRLYTIGRLGQVNCLDAKTGKPIWARNVVNDFGGKKPGWDLAGSPLIDGNKVILCPGGNNAAMVALDKTTGKTIWQGGGSASPGYSTPIIATINGVRQYVLMFAKGAIGVNTADGAVVWTIPWETNYDVNAATPIVIGNSVFITSGYGHGCALFNISGSTATMKWQSKDMQSQFSSPIYYSGYLYGTSDPGNLVCLDPKSGQTMWKREGFEKGGSIAVDGALIVMHGTQGDVIIVALETNAYRELGRMNAPLGGQSWTAPIVAQGKLIIRNKSTIACYDLR